jgi:hypothetical protein
MLAPVAPIAALAAWQRMLDRHAMLFAETAHGASVAIVSRYAPGGDGRPRPVVMPVCDAVPMLAWVREPQGMVARWAQFRGLKGLDADLLLVAGEGTLEAALAHDEPLGELKRQLRAGRMLFMVMRTRDELRERGWTDVLEALGLPFLGTCR